MLRSAKPEAVRALQTLQMLDQRLHNIGYRLLAANRPFCQSNGPNAGILLHDLKQYGDKEAARAAFGFSREIAIAAIVPGSVADKAGLRVNDGLIAINDFSPEQFTADKAGASSKPDLLRRVTRFKTLLEQSVIDIAVMRDDRRIDASLEPILTCRSRFQITPSKKRSASANGRMVSISSAMAEYFENDDEFAAVVAHELAHNLLNHKARLNTQKVNRGFFGQFGKSASRIKQTEIEADRLSVWLMINAGYDPQAAIRFWTRYGKQHGRGIFSASTHYRWKKRVKLFEEEMTKIGSATAVSGKYLPPLLMTAQ